MTFTSTLWHSIDGIYTSILRHPFVTGLTDGSLPRDSFRFYAVQDALYLRDFARALSVAAVPLAPTNLAYTSYLLAVAYGAPFHEALAALLPCYWIYWEVGKELERAGSRDPLFARWIATYASEEFGSIVRAVLETTDTLAPRLTEEDRDAMRRHFVTTSRYEWMFWEMGHRQEGWPV